MFRTISVYTILCAIQPEPAVFVAVVRKIEYAVSAVCGNALDGLVGVVERVAIALYFISAGAYNGTEIMRSPTSGNGVNVTKSDPEHPLVSNSWYAAAIRIAQQHKRSM